MNESLRINGGGRSIPFGLSMVYALVVVETVQGTEDFTTDSADCGVERLCVLLFDMTFQGQACTQHFSADITTKLLWSSSNSCTYYSSTTSSWSLTASRFQLRPVCTNHTAIKASTFDDRKRSRVIKTSKIIEKTICAAVEPLRWTNSMVSLPTFKSFNIQFHKIEEWPFSSTLSWNFQFPLLAYIELVVEPRLFISL